MAVVGAGLRRCWIDATGLALESGIRGVNDALPALRQSHTQLVELLQLCVCINFDAVGAFHHLYELREMGHKDETCPWNRKQVLDSLYDAEREWWSATV